MTLFSTIKNLILPEVFIVFKKFHIITTENISKGDFKSYIQPVSDLDISYNSLARLSKACVFCLNYPEYTRIICFGQAFFLKALELDA